MNKKTKEDNKNKMCPNCKEEMQESNKAGIYYCPFCNRSRDIKHFTDMIFQVLVLVKNILKTLCRI